jgi:hypothetical protein
MSQDSGSTGPGRERELEDSIRMLREQLRLPFVGREKKQELAKKIAGLQTQLAELREKKRISEAL